MGIKQDYEVGDHIRLTCPFAGGYVGEIGEIVHVRRDDQGNVLSLDILFTEQVARTRGTTVYPREVEPARPHAAIRHAP